MSPRPLPGAAAAALLALSTASCLAAQRAVSEGIPPPEPLVDVGGPVLEFDFPEVHVGVAEYAEGPTGTTVFHFPGRVKAAVDQRGGAPGTIQTDILRHGYDVKLVDAIAFSGGSAYGLAAAAGVAAEIKSRRQDPTAWDSIAVVPGAIIFDLFGRRFNGITPDEALGRAALGAARPGVFPTGARGAGRFAMQGSYFGPRSYSGQGAAFRQVGPTKIAVFTVVNARGTIVDRRGRVVRCGNDPARTDCGTIGEAFERAFEAMERADGPAGGGAASRYAGRDPARYAARVQGAGADRGQGGGADRGSERGPTRNTTLTLVVTNQRLPDWALRRMATHVHSSMGRAIQPFHTENDGDVLFAATTDQVTNPDLSPEAVYTLAADVAWDAVLASVPPLEPWPRETVELDPGGLDVLAGRYDLGTGAVLTIRREGSGLVAEATGAKDVYGFALGEPEPLVPTSEVDFLSRNARGDRLRFEVEGGRAAGLILNPGHWGLPARRLPD